MISIELEKLSLKEEFQIFVAWKLVPNKEFLLSSLTPEEIKNILKSYLELNVSVENMPKLNVPDHDLLLTPFKKIVPAEPKPNLLILLLALLKNEIRFSPCVSKELIKSFNARYDVIAPRNPLIKIITSDDQWTVYCFKPTQGSPLFIEREKSYDNNPGRIGNLFTSALIKESPQKYNRFYTVREAKIGDINIALTGEIDCVDGNGRPIEIRAKPIWKSENINYLKRTFLQSKLGGCSKVATGQFTKPRAFDAPAKFKKKFIQIQDLADKAGQFDGAFEYLIECLNKMIEKCHVGKVYKVSGTKGRPIDIEQDENFSFPVSVELINNCAEVIAELEN